MARYRIGYFGALAPLFWLAACASGSENGALVHQPAGGANIAALEAEALANRARVGTLETQVIALQQEALALRSALNRLLAVAETPPAAVEALELKPAPPPAAKPKPEAAPTTAKTEQFALHLASYRTPALAAEGWTRLRGHYGAVLDGLTPHIATLDMGGRDGVYYRLLAGPLKTSDMAKALCSKIEALGDYCVTTLFAGDRL